MDTENTFGQMEALIRVILSMELGMAMEYGQIKNKLKYFLVAIGWIKNRVLESMNGLGSRYIKANSDKIFGKDLAGCIN